MPIQTLVKPHPHSAASDLYNVCLKPTPFLAISSAGRRLVHQAEMVAPHLELAVIEGESGAGKQTLARLIHSQSRFARSSFTRFDAREWLLSEIDPQFLNGFTYLDRIELLAAPGQALLLRVLKSLQSGSARKFAIVASSESSLREMAIDGRLLPELAFRFAAVRFAIPPLRERREDIAPLASLFLERLSERYHLPRLSLAPGANVRLFQHDWPGNACELSSVLESAALESTNGFIHAEDLSIVSSPISARRISLPSSQVLNLDAVIRNHILLVLDLNHGNKLKSARQLGISRSTLYRLLDGNPDPSL
jgi:DNA-binding NtrC family response regulator